MGKYDRAIIGLDAEGKPAAVTIDVYCVIDAYAVTSSPLQHLIKKALCAGLRGHKDRLTDLVDIRDSAQRAVDMLNCELAVKAGAQLKQGKSDL